MSDNEAKADSLPAVANLRRALATHQTIAIRQVMADGIIAVAAKARDWPLLHEAVDIKIQDQRDFLADWDRRVRSVGNPNLPIIPDLGTISVAQAEEEGGVKRTQASRWRKNLEDPEAYHHKVVLAACRKAGLEPEENHRAEGTGENEWFTPGQYIEAARDVMGGIDLDPATHEQAQLTVQAKTYFTAKDDGLSKSWHGRVWLNPPYAQPAIELFTTKMATEYAEGRVSQAVMLTHNYTDTRWFHLAAANADALCFTRGRIRFIDPAGEEAAPTQGQAFFYYGTNREAFTRIFARFGIPVYRA